MRKGQIVKCVSVYEGVDYLTVGRQYTVTADWGSGYFTVTDDDGDTVIDTVDSSAHAAWELVSE